MVHQFTFKWPAGPKEVVVTGSFDNWKQTLPLVKQADGSFELTVPFKESDTQEIYKYIVDGEWLVSPTQKVIQDEHGNDNNYIDLKDLKDFSNKSVSSKSFIPEMGGIVTGGTDGGVISTGVPHSDFKTTVLPSSEHKQSTLGEPGVVIPQGEQLSAFETVRNVDPKTLNEPELSAEEKKKQKKKVKRSQYKKKKKQQKREAAGVVGDTTTTTDSSDPESTNVSRDDLLVETIAVSTPQAVYGATQVTHSHQSAGVNRDVGGVSPQPDTVPIAHSQAAPVLDTAHQDHAKQVEDTHKSIVDKDAAKDASLVQADRDHPQLQHADGTHITDVKDELKDDVKRDNVAIIPDEAVQNDEFLSEKHNGSEVKGLGNHVESQLAGNEASPGTLGGVIAPVTPQNDASLKAAIDSHDVDKNREVIEEQLTGTKDVDATNHTAAVAGVSGVGALGAAGIAASSRAPVEPTSVQEPVVHEAIVSETAVEPIEKNVNLIEPASTEAGVKSAVVVPEPTIKNSEVHPEPVVYDPPKTLDPKVEPVKMKDAHHGSPSLGTVEEPNTVEEEIVVADGNATRTQIEKEIQKAHGEDVVLEEFTPTPAVATVLKNEADDNDPSIVHESTEHTKTLVVEHDGPSEDGKETTAVPVTAGDKAKPEKADDAKATGKEANKDAKTTSKTAAKPAAKDTKTAGKDQKKEKKKGRFSRFLKKIFS